MTRTAVVAPATTTTITTTTMTRPRIITISNGSYRVMAFVAQRKIRLEYNTFESRCHRHLVLVEVNILVFGGSHWREFVFCGTDRGYSHWQVDG